MGLSYFLTGQHSSCIGAQEILLTLYHQPYNVQLKVQIMKLLITLLSSSSRYFLLESTHSPQRFAFTQKCSSFAM